VVHLFKKFGNNIVIDVPTGSVFTVDDISFDVIEYYNKYKTFDGIHEKLLSYNSSELDEAIGEVNQLISENVLFTEDYYNNLQLIEKRNPVVKALCLHVSHDCDLRCRYCFASTGSFKGDRKFMSLDVAKKAIDFLLSNSGRRKNLEVDFFGGEPLLNFEVVKKTVEYAKKVEIEYNKHISFTLTTNATNLTDDIIDYLNQNMDNVVLSHDGRKEVNDFMRIEQNGYGTYDKITKNIIRFIEKRNGKTYCVRGTYTAKNTDFSADVLHLANLNIKEISIEPVVLPDNHPYSLKAEHIDILKTEYERLALEIINRAGTEKEFNFFHFNIDLSGGPCVSKRVSGCGAGFEYMAVTPDGDLYPCHQFVDKKEFKLGNVFEGFTNYPLIEEFKKNTVFEKIECQNCWAKYYCSGGCAAANYNINRDVKKSYILSCELERERIECAIGIKIELMKNYKER